VLRLGRTAAERPVSGEEVTEEVWSQAICWFLISPR